MKYEFQKRVAAIFVAALFFIAVIYQSPIASNAAGEQVVVDYNTMVKTVKIDQEAKRVNISVPAEYYWLSIGYSTTYASADPDFHPYTSVSGESTMTLTPGMELPTAQRAAFITQFFQPNGASTGIADNPALSLANIPDGSIFQFDYSVGFQFRYQDPLAKIVAKAFIIGSDGNRNSEDFVNTVSTRTSSSLPITYDIVSTFTYHKQPGDIGIAFLFMVIPSRASPLQKGVTYSLTVNSCSIDMSLPRLYDLREEQQITNGLLTAIESQNQTIIDQNQQLIIQNDKILSGEDLNDHNVNGPGGFNDTVDQQQGQIQDNMADINNVPKPSPDTVIPDIGSFVPADGMNFLSTIMGGITSFSMVPTYLMIVVGLFVVSFIMFGKKEK